MNKTVKAKWLDALRTNKIGDMNIEQVEGRLRESEDSGTKRERVGLCCLGVLCEIAANEGVVTRMADVRPTYQFAETVYSYDGEIAELPPEVVKWAGLHAVNPVVPTKKNGEVCLSELNDDLGKSFEQIANKIERYL